MRRERRKDEGYLRTIVIETNHSLHSNPYCPTGSLVVGTLGIFLGANVRGSDGWE